MGRALVKEKLAACVNIIPQVTSIYEWQNEIIEDNEVHKDQLFGLPLDVILYTNFYPICS